jgi:hypothetical protein
MGMTTEAMDAVHTGGTVDCTWEEYVPPTGIGIRGVLHLYTLQRIEEGDFVRAQIARQEIRRLDAKLGFDPDADDA